MILDVGCGAFPKGDINCDLFIRDTGHRTGSKDVLGENAKAENFVLCDVQHLPFRDNTFSEFVSSHVIEHVQDHFLMFKEMVRVSSDKVTVLCPHELGELALLPKNPFHLGYFKKSWFYNAARKLGVNSVLVSYSKYHGFPNEFFPLFSLPFELKTEVRK